MQQKRVFELKIREKYKDRLYTVWMQMEDMIQQQRPESDEHGNLPIRNNSR